MTIRQYYPFYFVLIGPTKTLLDNYLILFIIYYYYYFNKHSQKSKI